jgi:outer membrane protein assembly factor BamA
MASTRVGSTTVALGIALCLAGSAPASAARWLSGLTSREATLAPERDAALPSDGQLQSQGARIGEVRIQSRELFDSAANDEITALSRLANRLHVATRSKTIEDQLLFRSGDLYQPGVLAESARLLRDSRYLRDASIRPVHFHDGVVDVEVVTQDVWTLSPGISFGRSGGANTSGFEIEDLNLLGTGTQLGLGFKSGVDRDSKFIRYRDRQLGSSWWGLTASYADNSDGRAAGIGLERPFHALDSRWAAGVSLQDDQRVDSRYDRGEVVDRFAVGERHATIYLGGSRGLIDGWVRRFSAGLTLDEHDFAPVPGAGTRLLPADRRLLYPWVAMEWVEDSFQTARNRDQIGRTEDYSLGWRAIARVGIASADLGSDRSAGVVSAQLANGVLISDRQSLQFELGADGRLEDGGLEAGMLEAQSRYYFRQSAAKLFYLNVSATVGNDLDPDQQVLLGGDSGLRGYPLRYQSGKGRWLLTAEQRFFTDWYPLQLFHVGGAVFYDMGSTWGRDPLGRPARGVLRDVGVGLRLGNSRSALGNVLHLDVAFPLDRDDSIKGLQFLVQTRKTF